MSVYFITAREVGRVKIGCAYNPQQRLNTLLIASPVDLTLEAVMRGSHQEERELHVRFDAHRVRGEWFTLVPEIELMIRTFRVRRQLTDDELKALMPAKPPREPGERYELQKLKRLLKSGDIHFPFREQVSA